MDSMLTGCPLSGALAALADSNHTDLVLRKMLIWMDNGSATADQTIEWGEED